jgi:hypothetical protein
MKVQQPRPSFILLMTKIASSASDDAIRAQFGNLDADERKMVESMLVARRGDDDEARTLQTELLASNSPGIAFMAEMMLKIKTNPKPEAPQEYRSTEDLDLVIGWIKWAFCRLRRSTLSIAAKRL